MADSAEELVAAVRQACIAAAIAAYEDAGMSGLCAEGRWELALDAMRHVDLGPLLPPAAPKAPEPSV